MTKQNKYIPNGCKHNKYSCKSEMVPKSTFDERNHIPTNFRGNLGRLGIIIQKEEINLRNRNIKFDAI